MVRNWAVSVFSLPVCTVLSSTALQLRRAQYRLSRKQGGQGSSNTTAFSSTALLQRNLVGMIFTFADFFLRQVHDFPSWTLWYYRFDAPALLPQIIPMLLSLLFSFITLQEWVHVCVRTRAHTLSPVKLAHSLAQGYLNVQGAWGEYLNFLIWGSL